MTFLLGVDHSRAKISAYDTKNQITEEHWLNGSQKFSNNVDLLIKEISVKFPSEKVERMVICIDDKCHNAIIESYLSTTSRYGFKNVTLFSTESAIFLKTLHDLNYDAKEKETIAIISDRKTIFCHVFQKNGREFMSKNAFFKCSSPGDDLINLEQLARDSKNLEDIDNVFLDEIISEKEFKEILPNVKYHKFIFSPNYSEAALMHAKINSPSFHRFQALLLNVQNVLNRKISLVIDSKPLITIPIGDSIPFIKHLTVEELKANTYKIIERNASGTKVENNYKFMKNESPPIPIILSVDKNANLHINVISTSDSFISASSNGKALNKEDLVSHFNIPQKEMGKNLDFNAVGIDLGTTRCFAAVNRRNGIETVVLDNSGERHLPSYVSFKEGNELCGQIVVNRLQNYSKSTVYDSKRIIGRNFNEIKFDKSWPFEVINVNDKPMIRVQGTTSFLNKTAEEIAAVLLKRIKQKVEEIQGVELNEVVITVPAAFNNEQKIATKIAASLAGWERVHLLLEPIAASITYFVDRPIPNKFNMLLFDFGGGTLDVCLINVNNENLTIINIGCDANLGGRDFDNILFDHFSSILKLQYNIDAIAEDKLKYLLMQKCIEIKHTLSISKEDILDVSDFNQNIEETIIIASHEFEKMSSKYLDKIKEVIIETLSKGSYTSADIHKILFVGGSSRMPMVQQLLRKMFKKAEHCCEENPDEVVAIGAAYYACYLNTKNKAFCTIG